MKKIVVTITLLVFSNIFMTLAWYGHFKLKEMGKLAGKGLFIIILLSWGMAFFEYMFQIPANTIGFSKNGGPFTLWQLKVLQEVITLIVFSVFMFLFFSDQPMKWNHLVGFFFLVLAVIFIFKDQVT